MVEFVAVRPDDLIDGPATDYVAYRSRPMGLFDARVAKREQRELADLEHRAVLAQEVGRAETVEKDVDFGARPAVGRRLGALGATLGRGGHAGRVSSTLTDDLLRYMAG